MFFVRLQYIGRISLLHSYIDHHLIVPGREVIQPKAAARIVGRRRENRVHCARSHCYFGRAELKEEIDIHSEQLDFIGIASQISRRAALLHV